MRDQSQHRTVHLRADDNGHLTIIGTPSPDWPTYLQVTGVPGHTSDLEVRNKVASIAIWPWPKDPVMWGKIADCAAGDIVRDLA